MSPIVDYKMGIVISKLKMEMKTEVVTIAFYQDSGVTGQIIFEVTQSVFKIVQNVMIRMKGNCVNFQI